MLPVEIVPIENSLVLRARGSELLILPQHVGHLKSCKTPKDFTGYFLEEALLNRPARKLFEAWLRKDNTLWQRIYNTVQKEMADVPADTVEPPANEAKAEKVAAPKEDKPEKKAVAKKPETKDVAVPAKKAAAKKEKEETPVVKPAKKATAPKAAKAKEKPATKPAKKAAAAPAKKKPATKVKKKG